MKDKIINQLKKDIEKFNKTGKLPKDYDVKKGSTESYTKWAYESSQAYDPLDQLPEAKPKDWTNIEAAALLLRSGWVNDLNSLDYFLFQHAIMDDWSEESMASELGLHKSKIHRELEKLRVKIKLKFEEVKNM